jgi:hypothetical protein
MVLIPTTLNAWADRSDAVFKKPFLKSTSDLSEVLFFALQVIFNRWLVDQSLKYDHNEKVDNILTTDNCSQCFQLFCYLLLSHAYRLLLLVPVVFSISF